MENTISILALILVTLFYISSKKNKVNRWLAFSAFLFSFAAFKESYVRHLVPWLLTQLPVEQYSYPLFVAYNVMVWLCAVAAPIAVTNAILLLCEVGTRYPRFKRGCGIVLAVALFAMTIRFPPWIWNAEQVHAQGFWLILGIYSFVLALFMTFLFFWSNRHMVSETLRAQKNLIAVVTLLPIWCAMLTTYVPYIISPSVDTDIWQVTVIALAGCIVFFLFTAFRRGVMGLRLKKENYDWDSELTLSNKGANYLSHQVKNQTAKVDLCLSNLHSLFPTGEIPEELDIIQRAMGTLRDGIDKFVLKTGQITLSEEYVQVEELLRYAISVAPFGGRLYLVVGSCCDVKLLCDKHHMLEVFVNLVQNAADAMEADGEFRVEGLFAERSRLYILTLADNGVGISDGTLDHVFEPYFTTKMSGSNYGLGLTYCKNVIEKHGGSISFAPGTDGGAVVTISLPLERIHKESLARVAGRAQ